MDSDVGFPKQASPSDFEGLRLDEAPHQEKVRLHRVAIRDKLAYIDEVLDHLVDQKCITTLESQDIQSKTPYYNKVRQLLQVLDHSPPKAFDELLVALYLTQDNPDLYNLLSDTPYDKAENVPLFGRALTYHNDLKAFHRQSLERVNRAGLGARARRNNIPRHDLESYIRLTLYPRTNLLQEMRTGFREMSLDLIRHLGQAIEAEELFKSLQTSKQDPRKVMLLGAPGVGKTATAYHFLKEHTEENLWKQQFHFVFFILFRDINHLMGKQMTFKNLLFQMYGPKPADAERTWKLLENHQEQVLFILDGYDECNGLGVNINDSYAINFQDPSGEAHVQTLLYNLIMGNILPRAKVLVTTRPHCGDLLKDFVDRTVELGGIDWEKLQEMIRKALVKAPQVIDGLIQYLQQHDNIVSLCYSPVNAKGFLDHVTYTHRGFMGSTIKEESLPSTRADLLLMLISNSLREHDRAVVQQNITRDDLIKGRMDLIKKLCHLAYDGLFEGESVQQLFSDKDLEAHNLNEDEVTECGLMSSHVSSVADGYWEVSQVFTNFEHLTFEEFFAALRIIDIPPDQMLRLLQANDGSRDIVTHLLLGLHGDEKCHWAIKALFPGKDSEYLVRQAQRILRVVWASPRPYYNNGILFCITALLESCQFHLAGSLRDKLANPFGCLNLSHTVITPSDCSAIAQFLRHVNTNGNLYEDALFEGRPDVSGMTKIIEAGGTKGLALNVNFSADMLKAISKALVKAPQLQHLLLMGQLDQSVTHREWQHFEPEVNETLKHIGFWGLLDSHTLAVICSRLHNLVSLKALVLYGNKFTHTIPESPLVHLQQLTNVRYLILQSCSVTVADMKIVAKLILDNQLLYLDITDNKEISDEGIALVADCMTKPQVRLQGIILDRCNITPVGVQKLSESLHQNETLKILDFARNRVGDGYKALVKLLSENQTLEELDLAECQISSDGVYCLLDSLRFNKSLFRLCVVKNEMSAMDLSTHTIDILSSSRFLRVLDLSKCNLNDDLLATIYETIKDNHTLSVLDVSQNPHLSEKHIVRIIQKSTLKHLNLAVCQLGREGWRKVAEALLTNVHLVSCMAGDPDAEDDTVAFLQVLEDYEPLGPLEHLFLRGDSHKLAPAACRLERRLMGRVGLVSFVRNVWAFYMMSGMYWSCLDKDIRMWISFAGLEV